MRTTQAQRRATETYRKKNQKGFVIKVLWEVLGLLSTLKLKK